MNRDADFRRSALTKQVRSSASLIVREWRRGLLETSWSAVLASDSYDEIGQRYLPALLEIIARQVERPSADLAALYRDELFRYELALPPEATQRRAPEQRATATELIEAQRVALAHALPGPAREILAPLLDEVNGPLLRDPAKRISLLLLGDCLMNEIRCFLSGRVREDDVAVRGYHLYFSGALSVPFDAVPARYLANRQAIDIVGFSPFTFDGLPLFRELLIRAEDGNIDEKSVESVLNVVAGIFGEIRSLTDAPVLLHNACGAPVGKDRAALTSLPPLTASGRAAIGMLNAGLASRAAGWDRVVVVDETRIARRLGLRRLSGSAIPGGPVPAALFHTSRLGRELAEVYWEFADSQIRFGHIRMLVVDLDGTLWSGVMAEGAVDHFTERQELLSDIARQGMVLVALSKGSPDSVRWGELRISQQDFAAVHRTWGAKEDGLRRMTREFNVRAEHIAVIDDSPAERELLRSAFPGLATFDPADPRTWRRLTLLRDANRGGATSEARHRAERYRASHARREFVAVTPELDERMRQLGLTLTFGPMTAADVPRALELLRRTNQFNTTGLLPDKSQLLRMTQAVSGHSVFTAHLRDRFGDFGLVGVIVVRHGDLPSIESFVMSCRAMGYGAEQIILDLVISRFGMPLSARLVHTRLNEPCHGLYASAGFIEKEPGYWLLTVGQAVRLPNWFDVLVDAPSPPDPVAEILI